MMMTGRGVAVAMAVGAVIGWKAVDWVDQISRDIDRDKATERHLQAAAIVNEVEARWGPPARWAAAFHTHLPEYTSPDP